MKVEKIIGLFLIFGFMIQSTFAQKSFARDSIDVLKYYISIDSIDCANKILSGNTLVVFQPRVDQLRHIPLDLLGFTIDSLFVNGASQTTYSYNDTLLVISSSTPIDLGDTANVRVFYHGTPAIDPRGGGFYFNDPYVYNIGVALEYTPHSFGRAWFPCVDDFMDKALFSYSITVDTSLAVICGGLLADTLRVAGGRMNWQWLMAEPIPPYLASVAIGPYVCASDTFNGMNGNTPINIYVPQSLESNVSGSFVHLKSLLTAYENYFGPYLWERVGYTGVPFSVGAMEHATNIAYPNIIINGNMSYESIVAHELSHHWFGNLVTCSSANEMWINEGWAVFCEFIYKESIYGYDAMQVYIKSKLSDVIKKAHYDDGGFFPVGNVPSNITYGTTVYDQGGLVVHTLRNYMGDSLFFPAVRRYLDSLKFENSTIASMRDIFAASSGIDLTDFFDAWVYREGFPHFDVDSMTIAPNGGNSDVTVYLRQKLFGTTQFANSNRVELTFVDSLRNMYSVIAEFSGQTGSDMFTVPFVPAAVIVDMNEKTADAIISYNQLIGSTGTYTFASAYNAVEITNFSDTVLLRSEFHRVAPDPVVSNPNIYRISPNHYWRIGGIFPTGTTFSVQFDYNSAASISNGYLDSDLMPTITSCDSLILIYRPGPGFDWEIVPFTRLGNFTVGKIKTTNGRSGEYALGIGEPFQSGLQVTQATGFNIYPNPSSDFFVIEFNSLQDGILSFSSENGTIVYSRKIESTTKSIEWRPKGVASGNYIVTQTAKNGIRIASTTITFVGK